MVLSDLRPGETARVTKILGHGAFRHRVIEMGFVRGREVTCILNAPLQDPVKYKLMDYEVSLRRAEADLIDVEPTGPSSYQSSEKEKEKHAYKDWLKGHKGDKVINVALVGNPNCGKTSLFNCISGAHEHVGNYAGVTVDAKEGELNYKGYHINIVDLPGTYSLSAYSPEELYVTRYLREESPDVIVNVVVASNLERNLYLTTELIDMNRSMVIALNMYDELKRSKAVLDHENLGKLLGVPAVPTQASAGKGLDRLLDTIIEVYEMKNRDMRHIHVKMRPELEQSVNVVKDAIKSVNDIDEHFSPRYLAIKLLEDDPEVEKMIADSRDSEKITALRDGEKKRIEKKLGEDAASAIAADKYGFIQGALGETLTPGTIQEEKSTRIIDAFVTNKLFGFPIFILIMWFMFWCTFRLGAYPMSWIESLVAWIASLTDRFMAEGPLKDMIVDGIIGGVGGVIVFLPNILILYFFISFMEDSGYMARVAFIMDKLMHRMGLHGKSFIPLIMGFGCNVPAIMSSRIIESKSSRLITILINPFISCSARIPIYVMLVGCFFPQYGATVFLGLYLLGIAVAVITARMLRRYWFKQDETPFVMELPPYRLPTARATLRDMWSKARQYLRKMGGIILVASIIIWALSYFPRYSSSSVPQEYKEAMLAELPGDVAPAEADEMALNAWQQEHSILGYIGKAAEPVMRPMDFGWKTTVSLLAGASAKETVVSTLGVLYVGDDSEQLLSERLTQKSPVTGKAPFTAASALAFMVFVLLYFPCIATLTAIARETGSWRYSLFSAIYNTAVAWILSFLVYRVALLFM